jgi:hypothetical protein
MKRQINIDDVQPGTILRTYEGTYYEVIDGGEDGEWFPVVNRTTHEPDLVTLDEIAALIPPPPQGLATSEADPAFAMGPVQEQEGRHGVERWRACAEYTHGRWEGFVSIVTGKER